MGYEDNHGRADQAHGLPALLSFDDTFQAAYMEWIIKDETGGFETDFVLCEIAPVLILIPSESHDRSGIITCTKKYVQFESEMPHLVAAQGRKYWLRLRAQCCDRCAWRIANL